MPLTQIERTRLAVAVQTVISVVGLKKAQENGAKSLLASLMNRQRQEETIKKCPPHMRETIEARFAAVEENQDEVLQLIESILDPKWKDSKR
jgi:hypothetical protein